MDSEWNRSFKIKGPVLWHSTLICCLLTHLEKQWEMVQVFGHLPPMWKTQMDFLAPGFIPGFYGYLGSEPLDRSYLCVCVCVVLNFQINKIHLEKIKWSQGYYLCLYVNQHKRDWSVNCVGGDSTFHMLIFSTSLEISHLLAIHNATVFLTMEQSGLWNRTWLLPQLSRTTSQPPVPKRLMKNVLHYPSLAFLQNADWPFSAGASYMEGGSTTFYDDFFF